MKIQIFNNEVLRNISTDVTVFDDEITKLVESMKDLVKKEGAVGLAAPQVGINKNIVVCMTGNGKPAFEKTPVVLINPEIVSTSGGVTKSIEGCLSLPGVVAKLNCRYRTVTITSVGFDGMPEQNEFTNEDAVIAQHEMDHLIGKTLIDRMSINQKVRAKNKVKRIRRHYKRGSIKRLFNSVLPEI